MDLQEIILKNVTVHNLKNISLKLKPQQLIVFTGVSGSGKSSLAFDTIYVEGQRRYVESLSTYIRRHMEELPKPDAEVISGLSPTIAIEQKSVGKNPRSTVGTLTGIYDYLRVLYARIGTCYCPISLEKVEPQSREKIIYDILYHFQGRLVYLLSPYAKAKKSEFKEDIQELTRLGYRYVRMDEAVVELSEELSIDGKKAHDMDLVIDRLKIEEANKERLIEAITGALEKGSGVMMVLSKEDKEEKLYSTHAYSQKSGLSYGPLEPMDFSFNHPQGMCPSCQGLGRNFEFDLERIINSELSIAEDCCLIASSYNTVRYGNIYDNLARLYHFDVHTPWKKLSSKAKEVFLNGIEAKWTRMVFKHPHKRSSWIEFVHWKGVLQEARERFLQAQSEHYRKKMMQWMTVGVCKTCLGSRLKPYPSKVKLGSLTLPEVTKLPLLQAKGYFEKLILTPEEALIGKELIKEVITRLSYLCNVGLHYLDLDRSSPSLSGGEAQRVRLAAQLGAGLVGVTYVLDEPSIGLHPRDNNKLIEALKRLRDQGNTVIVVEHDEEMIRAADEIIDMGPKAGKEGGEILYQGNFKGLLQEKKSLTGSYLKAVKKIPAKKNRKVKGEIKIIGACHHNLKGIEVAIPLGQLVAITGVSGSGKSSLISDILFPAVSNVLMGSDLLVGKHERIEGLDLIDKVIAIDQSPIGKTPRSNPATYIKVFDDIRDLFSSLPESQAHGFKSGHFSFNVKAGSCVHCQGMGMIKVDMDFLEDEWIECHFCKGQRFDSKTLAVRYKSKSIHDVLQMTPKEALEHFGAIPKIHTKLETLLAVGLDYIRIGQPSPTLSGGEAQRIKLAKELCRPSTGKTLYILDEPTTGLHFYDIEKLTSVLQKLVDAGNTVVVIEHNLDLIQCCDYILELGPEAGEEGGRLIAQGSIEEMRIKDTPTGGALKAFFQPSFENTSKRIEVKPQWDFIRIEKALQNNLKGITVDIPRGKITVCTGPSGSGKSSFAFETLYAEGQRRYTESLSHYARQFIHQMPKPILENSSGLSPAIAIEQKGHMANSRSTVGTITEIYDYLRILYAHLGQAHCPETKEKIVSISKDYVVEEILKLEKGSKLQILAPINLKKNETFETFKERLQRQGFLRLRMNKTYYELDENIPYDSKAKTQFFLVVDRLVVNQEQRKRLFQAVDQASSLGENTLIVDMGEEDHFFNLSFCVRSTGKSYPPITPQTFSFNTEKGMCLECNGLGLQFGANFQLLEKELKKTSFFQLLHQLWKENTRRKIFELLQALAHKEKGSLSEGVLDEESSWFWNGSSNKISIGNGAFLKWKGVKAPLAKLSTSGMGSYKSAFAPLMQEHLCSYCEGSRLNPLARHVEIQGKTLPDFCLLPISKASIFLQNLELSKEKKEILKETKEQIARRLALLEEIGLGYLSLMRSAPTLSGGEAQRVRLARQLGSMLSGCLYVLDEPTIGLHPENNRLLNQALLKLKKLGNTLVLVEHDPLTVQIADYILDFGPGAGLLGGKITASGSYKEILKNPHSLTGLYLSGKKKLPLPQSYRKPKGSFGVRKASLHNLQNVEAGFPLGCFTCISGVSGSGKSSLVKGILAPLMQASFREKNKEDVKTTPFGEVFGLKHFENLVFLSQDPIGHTTRADVSTYSDLLTPLRLFFSSLPQAQIRGLQGKHFSFNHKKGMCLSCFGHGTKSISMQFLPTLKVPCEACQGYRLNPQSLTVRYKDKHLGQILEMSVQEAKTFLPPIPKLIRIIDTLEAVGLSYLKLSQDISSLSGGEAQRLRLSRELTKRSAGKTLYVFDEPTVGLHSEDIGKLLPIFQAIVDKGSSLVIIEHNLDILASSDYIIDMGPQAGEEGGKIVAKGTPKELSENPNSLTGFYLKQHLSRFYD